MIIVPAIDLYNHACVRLNKGSFDAVTTYSEDPVHQAKLFEAAGAVVLHVVDLNGAKEGRPAHLDVIAKIKSETTLLVQSGGGLRNRESIIASLEGAVDRVVLGSVAVTDTELVQSLIEEYGVERFVLAFDVNIAVEPMLAIKGWVEKTSISLWDVLERYAQYSGLTILCTDIGRDGLLTGPNVNLYGECVQRFAQFSWQASGGVSQLSDLQAVKSAGAASVIVGKALYEKKFDLSAAIASVSDVD